MTTDGPGPARPPAQVYGAAAERTELAWQRTALGVVIGCFVVFHTAFALGVAALGVTAAGLGLLVAGLFVFAFPTGRYLRGVPSNSWPLLLIVTVSIATLGLLSLMVSVVSLLS